MSKGRQGAAVSARASPCRSVFELLGHLGHEIRLEIVCSLAESPKDVSTLANCLELDVTTISHHLRRLWECGLVQVEAFKQRHVYRLGDRLDVTSGHGVLHLSSVSGDGGQVTIQLPLRLLHASADTTAKPVGGRH
ncbi:MAG: winged helix-turn-helix transcriptional regulator [Planctomycetes bacterium]|nr:winged helix-turn-helix transcriptional regulator [Planctomycetota bacterium]